MGRRPVSIRRSLARNLSWLVLVASGVIAVMTFVTARHLVTELAGSLIEQRLAQTELALKHFFAPVENVLLLFRDWGEAGLLASVDYNAIELARGSGIEANISSVEHLNLRFIPLLERAPQISSMMIADDAGGEYMLLRHEDTWSSRITYADRWNRQTLSLSLDGTGASLDQSWREIDYDPRRRPWFRNVAGGDANHPVYWTEPYTFFTTRDPGITASLRWSDPRDPDRMQVMAFDILLSDISRFTTGLPVSPRGKVLVGTEDRRIAGLPRDPRFGSDEGIRKYMLKPLRELGLPEVNDAIRAWDEQGLEPGSIYSYQSGGELWWAGVRVFHLGDQRFRIAVVAPHQDFLEPVIQQRNRTIAVIVAAILAAFTIASILARRYSRPLAALAAQAERIEALDVDHGDPIVSRLREVDQLASTQERMRAALTSFSRYVPIDVVRELMQRNEAANIGGARRVITVLFTDIQGFTTIAEAMDPEDLTQHMSGYFDAMLGEVQGDGFGEVTQLTGDGFVAFWGAPVDCADHAARAADAVLRCRARLAALNRDWEVQGLPVLRTRFGLATGPVVVGNVGSPVRLVYTAVGDTINLASRLEGLNRFYGTWVMVSEDMRNAAGGAFAWRRLDRVRAKGKHQPIDLYELLGRAGEVDAATLAFAERYEEALAHFGRREFAEAEQVLAALQLERPDDLSIERLLALSREYAVEPPPHDWDGTTVYHEK
jgi:adenylate cyclase